MTTDLDHIEFNLEMLATGMEAIANTKDELDLRLTEPPLSDLITRGNGSQAR